jgi:hypothetical protein
MATYFFIIITLVIICLLIFALSESHGKNSPHAREKDFQIQQQPPSKLSKINSDGLV